MVVGAAEHHRPRRRTGGANVKIVEPHADRRQGIDVGRADLAAEAADIRKSGVIGNNKDNIRRLVLGKTDRRCKTSGKHSRDRCYRFFQK
jgi:hypothetical protein